MSMVQTYILTAAEGRVEALETLLRRLADIVRPIAGCQSVAILHEAKAPGRYVFMETYVDEAAHKASSAHVPKDILNELMGLLGDKPQVLTLSSVLTL